MISVIFILFLFVILTYRIGNALDMLPVHTSFSSKEDQEAKQVRSRFVLIFLIIFCIKYLHSS